MNHFWKDVEGYFTFPEFYARVAASMPGHEARLVEVGCWKGQSAACLGVELRNRDWHTFGRFDWRLYLIDTFAELGASIDEVAKRLAPLNRIGDSEHLVYVPNYSDQAANEFADGECDFVFIDADHSYEACRRDIAAWLPKVKRGGIIAGHDFKVFPSMNFGVVQAVSEAFDHFEVFRGDNQVYGGAGGSEQMRGQFWPVWAHRVGGGPVFK